MLKGLRPEHHIDNGRAGNDFCPFRLCHTASHANHHMFVLLLERFQAPQFGIDFLSRFFANMTGVQNHHIGLISRRNRAIAGLGQCFFHALAVIDIHLAAIGFDKTGLVIITGFAAWLLRLTVFRCAHGLALAFLRRDFKSARNREPQRNAARRA